jgi:magnesium chelatase family protein
MQLPVEVEVDVSPAGLPKLILVGLAEAAVKESGIGSNQQWSTPAFNARETAWSSIWLRPTCRRKRRRSICRIPGRLSGSRQMAADRLAKYAVVGDAAVGAGTTRPVEGAVLQWRWRR